MMRWAKVLGFIAGGLLGLIVLVAGAVWVGGSRVVVWAVEHPLSAMVGRQISLGGPLTIHWGAPTQIVVENVHVANAGWGSQPDMFSAKRLEIDIFVRTLLRGPTRIPLIDLEGAKLLLETSNHGERNWDFGMSSAAPQKRHQFPNLEKLALRNGDLVYRNGETKAETVLGITQAEINAPDPRSAINIAAEGTFQKQPIRIAGTVGPLTALRDTTTPYPVKLDGAVDQVRLTADGTLQEPLDFAGVDMRLSLSGAKLAALASALGVPFPEVPDFRSTGELTGGNGEWELKALTITLGKSDLEGGIAVSTNAKVPYVQANLTSSYIDLADFKGLYGGKPATSSAPAKPPDPSGRVSPDTPIEVHRLPGLNAGLTFDSRRIKSAGGLPFERVSLGLQLKDGTLTIKPLRFHAAQGDVDLNLSFTPFTSKGPPHLRADVDIRHIDLHQLLGGPAMPQVVRQTAGIAGGFVKIDTRGVSLREFLAHMKGDAGLFMENGQLSQLLEQLAPIDVLGALGVYVRGDKPVPINCLVSRFDINDGIATASSMLIDTTETLIAGKGNVNFADETLMLTITPYNKSTTVVTLRTPVDVQGTFDKPAFRPKMGGAAARLGAALGLGVLFPPAAVLALVDMGLGEHNACSKALAVQRPPSHAPPATGSSEPQ
jgi:uncharacterized protein involved in outer membrane biogenesis